jgi:hypothetical protein
MYQTHLTKPVRDTLLIIHYGIDREIDKAHIDTLIMRNYVTPKHPSGWMTTSAGREYVRKLK